LNFIYISYKGVCGQSQLLFQDDETTQKPLLPGVVPEHPILNPGGSTTPSTIRHVLGEATTHRGPAWLPPSLTVHVPIFGSVYVTKNTIKGLFDVCIYIYIQG
jgi:hypothetical protein